eukprot:1160894-Pelagomonas_calceolata.AAC.19
MRQGACAHQLNQIKSSHARKETAWAACTIGRQSSEEVNHVTGLHQREQPPVLRAEGPRQQQKYKRHGKSGLQSTQPYPPKSEGDLLNPHLFQFFQRESTCERAELQSTSKGTCTSMHSSEHAEQKSKLAHTLKPVEMILGKAEGAPVSFSTFSVSSSGKSMSCRIAWAYERACGCMQPLPSKNVHHINTLLQKCYQSAPDTPMRGHIYPDLLATP